MKFLIVDDHTVVRRGIRQILVDAFESCEVTEAQNAAELMTLSRAETWDAVVLDITLPDRNGLDVLKDLKQERPHLPVVV